MSKGTITIVIDSKSGRTDVDIDLPDNDCEKIDPEMQAILELMGVDGGKRVMRESPPGQTDGNPSKNKAGGDGG